MDPDELVQQVCRKYCAYYKPSKDSELACMGFIVLDRMTKTGKQLLFETSGKIPGEATIRQLTEGICASCSFYEEDCDFVQGKEDALPCGSFVLIGNLIDEGIIIIDDIKNMN